MLFPRISIIKLTLHIYIHLHTVSEALSRSFIHNPSFGVFPPSTSHFRRSAHFLVPRRVAFHSRRLSDAQLPFPTVSEGFVRAVWSTTPDYSNIAFFSPYLRFFETSPYRTSSSVPTSTKNLSTPTQTIPTSFTKPLTARFRVLLEFSPYSANISTFDSPLRFRPHFGTSRLDFDPICPRFPTR